MVFWPSIQPCLSLTWQLHEQKSRRSPCTRARQAACAFLEDCHFEDEHLQEQAGYGPSVVISSFFVGQVSPWQVGEVIGVLRP